MIGRDGTGGNGEVKTWKLGKKAEKFLARVSETGESRLPPTPPLANARSPTASVRRSTPRKKEGPRPATNWGRRQNLWDAQTEPSHILWLRDFGLTFCDANVWADLT